MAAIALVGVNVQVASAGTPPQVCRPGSPAGPGLQLPDHPDPAQGTCAWSWNNGTRELRIELPPHWTAVFEIIYHLPDGTRLLQSVGLTNSSANSLTDVFSAHDLDIPEGSTLESVELVAQDPSDPDVEPEDAIDIHLEPPIEPR
ncbi:predicted protein [Streptomyces sp. AA4]|nr:predicted protein [Streptomyces sp. AA4]